MAFFAFFVRSGASSRFALAGLAFFSPFAFVVTFGPFFALRCSPTDTPPTRAMYVCQGLFISVTSLRPRACWTPCMSPIT